MFIANQYQSGVTGLPDLRDDDYMLYQIWLIKHLFHNEIASIKNTRHELLAFTKRFAEEFGATEKSLERTAAHLPHMNENDYSEIHRQEELLIINHEFQDSVYLVKKKNEVINYVMRKRPLINPATNNCLGIFINSSRVTPGFFRQLLLKKILPSVKNSSSIVSPELTEQQQQIFFCLLMGFQSRKEIAAILSNLTKSEYNENRIKNSLQALYNKFGCSTPGQLLDLISSSETPVELPGVLPTGNYTLD